MYTVVMAISGVLRAPVGGQPIPEGVALYHALTGDFNLVLSDDHGLSRADWDHFAITQGLDAHSGIVPWISFHRDHAEDKLAQCDTVRRGGYSVAFVIDPDPAVCALLIATGYNTMLFTHNEYAHPDWRPDAHVHPRPWDDISHQVAENARLRLADTRSDDGSA
jgi:hypothetical protein